MAKDPRLKRAGVSGFNKAKRTPGHKTKSHVVVAKVGDKVKTIRFGQQGKTGDRTMTKRAKSFKARHGKNIAKGKMSAAYWANKVKWQRGAITMPMGKGTYGKTKGRPPKKNGKGKMTAAQKKLPAALQKKIMASKKKK